MVPVLVLVGIVTGIVFSRRDRPVWAWWSGALAWVATIGSVGAAMFPMIAPSYADVDQSLTVWNASSSLRTLSWMLGFAVVFVPLIVFYTSWAFRVMRGKVSPEQVEHDEHAY